MDVMNSTGYRWTLALALLALTACSGCSVTVLKPSSEDSVRERVARVEARNADLELENEGLRTQLAEHLQEISPDEAAIQAAMPRLAAMVIASSSIVESPPGGPRELILRLAPSDDRGRFLQIVGNLMVRVVAVPADGPPLTLAVAEFGPEQIRDAWRGGMLGSNYVLDIPLDQATHLGLPGTVDVVIRFTDATTGREFRDEQPVRVSDAAV
jgi:hypothetical protein